MDTIAYSLSVIQTIILFNYWNNMMTKIYLLAETEITAPEAAPGGIENAGGTLADDRRTLLPRRPGTDGFGVRSMTNVAIIHGNDLGTARTADRVSANPC